MKPTPPLRLYYAFSRWLGPAAASRVLQRRAARGKEDPDRLAERFGVAGKPRPDGALIWLHAASVGESVSLLPLIEALAQARPDLTILVTTGTVTSARMMAERLPEGVIHQFAPVDTFEAVGRFLDHWRPDFLGVVESEIWPVMLAEARRRGMKTALISARLSERTARGWAYAPRSIKALLGQFDAILAQNQTVETRLKRIGAPAGRLQVAGSLKQAAAPLPASDADLAEWRSWLGERPLWLAASTHEGEESAAMTAHAALRHRAPEILTVIAPRHPDRGDALAEQIQAGGARVARRSTGEAPAKETEVLLVDVLGELGLWFRLSPVVFVGGSLVDAGGHNPLEPARLGAALLFGPHVEAVADDCRRLEEGGAAIRVEPAEGEDAGAALARVLLACLDEQGRPTEACAARGARALALTKADASALDRTMAAIAPLLPPVAPSPLEARNASA